MDQLRAFGAGDLSIRADVAARQVTLRLFEWGVPADTPEGPELIEQYALGAAGVRAEDLVLRMDHLDPPIGRGIPGTLDESKDDGPYVTFQASNTARATEGLELASDGTYTGASVGFVPMPPDEYRTINRQRVGVRKALHAKEASLTWRPVHKGSAIIAIRQEGQDVADQDQDQAQDAPPATAPSLPNEGVVVDLLTRMEASMRQMTAELSERSRRLVDVPSSPQRSAEAKALIGRWMRAAMIQLAGERVPDLELRALADVTTADNLGVVPANIRSEVIGIIDPARPFLASTTEVQPGDSGVTQTFPRIEQRPLVGTQAAEKAEVASRKTIIGTVDFGMITIAGAGDLSLQLLKRSSPAFLELWFQLLNEAYAIDADDKAVDALLAAGVQAGTGAFDPTTFLWGESFTNASEVAPGLQLRPNRMWLSTAAYVAMMDARTPAGGGGEPMFPGLVQLEGVTRTAQGEGPAPLAIRPVLVPALDDEAVDVVIGPSRGFAWAEDGTYQLQADVPSKAGRDVGLAGMLWFMPVYPAAFTTYALAP